MAENCVSSFLGAVTHQHMHNKQRNIDDLSAYFVSSKLGKGHTSTHSRQECRHQNESNYLILNELYLETESTIAGRFRWTCIIVRLAQSLAFPLPALRGCTLFHMIEIPIYEQTCQDRSLGTTIRLRVTTHFQAM